MLKRIVGGIASLSLLVAPSAVLAQANVQGALDQVDSLFGEDYYAWFGSMYHRQSGGAYYSASARANPEVYPPHIESTSKYTRVIEWSDQVANTPQGLKTNTIGYVRPKQVGDPDHDYYGFFLDQNYKYLSPKNNGNMVSEKRAARALGFSTGMLKLFGSSPKYPLPTAEQNPGTLSHLQSSAKFHTWLENRNWNRTWSAGGAILQQGSAIKNLEPDKRQEILNTAWDYLKNEQQNASTGLWGNTGGGVSNDDPYIILNGAHKLVSFYRNFDHEVPNAEALKQTMLDTVKNEDAKNLLYTYNSSQLADNLNRGSEVEMTDAELEAFLASQAANLSQFKMADGGFTRTLGPDQQTRFRPAQDGPESNTDVGGLALKARDALNRLVNGQTIPPAAADTPYLYALSGENSEAKVTFEFEGKSLTAKTADGIRASKFSATNTDGENGPANDGFHNETGPANDFEIGHRGFGDAQSYYQFAATPDSGDAMDLYFLALTGRNGSGKANEHERILLEYALGEDPGDSEFKEAGATTLPGVFKTRDIPLITIDPLQDLDETVTFRIYGKNFDSDGRTFRLDSVKLFAPVPEPGTLGLLSVGVLGLLAGRPRR